MIFIQYDAAWYYVVDRIQDVKALCEKTGLTERSVYNIRTEVKALVDKIVKEKERREHPDEQTAKQSK